MRSLVALSACLSLTTLALTTAAAGQSVTTRIETRPYYGAVVTVEQGVRVWRPLPPHDRVIINPDGKTPLNLGSGPAYPMPPIVVQQENRTLVERYFVNARPGITTHRP